jgi:grdX protein
MTNGNSSFLREWEATLKKKLIVTNNPKVKDFYFNDTKGYAFQYDIEFIEKREDLFNFVRDKIHTNWHLINNPMAGNIAVHKHPFKSIALEEGDIFDERSLFLWDEATERLHRASMPNYPNEVIEDFAHLDFILFTDNLPF